MRSCSGIRENSVPGGGHFGILANSATATQGFANVSPRSHSLGVGRRGALAGGGSGRAGGQGTRSRRDGRERRSTDADQRGLPPRLRAGVSRSGEQAAASTRL